MATHPLKTAVIVGLVPLLAALGYTCWTFYARWHEDQRVKQAAQAKEAEDARKFLSIYGGEEVKITQFYVSPQTVHAGDTVSICYGVLNAKTLKLEPALPDVYPALSHCVQTAPRKTTTYRLVADGKNGKQATQDVTVIVK